jgi:hypothetical protein
MRIAIPNGKGEYHLLTNVGLQCGDRAFPLTFQVGLLLQKKNFVTME